VSALIAGCSRSVDRRGEQTGNKPSLPIFP
jgi:hypothetical protein